VGGAIGAPRWPRIARTVGLSVMKAMMRISAPHRVHIGGKNSSMWASGLAHAQRREPGSRGPARYA